jgi:hypothetical protein
MRQGLLSFHDYIVRRRYSSGRGSKAGWQFVIRALGDPHVPNARRWDELHEYLRRRGEDACSIRAARAVWSSYTSRLSRLRVEQRDPPGRGYYSSSDTQLRETER